MAENDHVSALAQGVDPFRLRWRGLAVGGNRQASKQDAEQCQSNDGHNLLLPVAINGETSPRWSARVGSLVNISHQWPKFAGDEALNADAADAAGTGRAR